jgi:hypothetical protein
MLSKLHSSKEEDITSNSGSLDLPIPQFVGCLLLLSRIWRLYIPAEAIVFTLKDRHIDKARIERSSNPGNLILQRLRDEMWLEYMETMRAQTDKTGRVPSKQRILDNVVGIVPEELLPEGLSPQ